MTKSLEGIITPLITPFSKGKIDKKAIHKLNAFVAQEGVKAVFPASSAGCFPFLTVKEHIELLKTVHDSLADGVLFLPGVGRNSIAETLEVAKAAARLDPYAVVIVTPYYIRLNDDALLGYFDRVAGSISERIILYNIPQLTGEWITARVAGELARKRKNVIGMKESSGDFRSFASLLDRMPRGFLLFQGQDDLLLDSLMIGASGGVCGTTNFTDMAVRIYDMHKKGNRTGAKRLQKKLTSIMRKVNKAQFPSGYNFMFYKRVMGTQQTNAVPPIPDVPSGIAKELTREERSLRGE